MVSEKVIEDDYCTINEGKSWRLRDVKTLVVSVKRGLYLLLTPCGEV
jgi:hypothetical protein